MHNYDINSTTIKIRSDARGRITTILEVVNPQVVHPRYLPNISCIRRGDFVSIKSIRRRTQAGRGAASKGRTPGGTTYPVVLQFLVQPVGFELGSTLLKFGRELLNARAGQM